MNIITKHLNRERVWALLFMGLFLWSCQPPGLKDDGAPNFVAEEKQYIFSLSPQGTPPDNPSNAVANNPQAAHFGQFIFYDTRLSGNNTLSCASCHNPTQGWSDGRPQAVGLQTGRRNSPSLWNVAYQRWCFWDGRSDSLWSQALQPLESPAEMGLSRVTLYKRFRENKDLKEGYEAVFGSFPMAQGDLPQAARPSEQKDAQEQALNRAWQSIPVADQEIINRFAANIGKALEAFERRIVSGPSDFDRFVQGLRNNDLELQKVLPVAAQEGLRLFIGRGQCVLCHTGPSFSDAEFHNIGLPKVSGLELDAGRYAGIPALLQDPLNALGVYSDVDQDDPWLDKLHYLAQQEGNQGAFKTPSLREVSATAPYMHDGRFQSLEEVLSFYSAPAPEVALGRREDTIQALNLTAEEIQQLVAFLKSLNSGLASEELGKQPLSAIWSGT